MVEFQPIQPMRLSLLAEGPTLDCTGFMRQLAYPRLVFSNREAIGQVYRQERVHRYG